jgi:preprotein translocase subunit SecE
MLVTISVAVITAVLIILTIFGNLDEIIKKIIQYLIIKFAKKYDP